MYDTIREWPRYVKVPFPIAKVYSSLHHLITCLLTIGRPVINIFLALLGYFYPLDIYK